jgi:hypothetical protein
VALSCYRTSCVCVVGISWELNAGREVPLEPLPTLSRPVGGVPENGKLVPPCSLPSLGGECWTARNAGTWAGTRGTDGGLVLGVEGHGLALLLYIPLVTHSMHAEGEESERPT